MQTVKPLGAVWSFVILAVMVGVGVLDSVFLDGQITKLINVNAPSAAAAVAVLAGLLKTILAARAKTLDEQPSPEVIGARSVNWARLPWWRRVL